MGRLRPLALALVMAALACAGCDRAPHVPERLVSIRGASLRCYLADTDEEQLEGLQGIEIAPDEGMLFVWSEPAVRTFDIKEVGYPLDVVWIDRRYRVLGVSRLATGGVEVAESPGRVIAVVETRAGWVERNGVRAGDTVGIAQRR